MSSPTDIAPAAAPELAIPESDATCQLSAIDTTCYLTVPADTLVEPIIPGHELMNFPTFAFLIVHRSSGSQILFDLGCRKDFWNLPTPIAQVIDEKVPGIKVDHDLADILKRGGLNLERLEAAIISHHHYDHMGDPGAFPSSMKLIVGPKFSSHFLPGYPTVPSSPVYESAFSGRQVLELDFSEGLVVAGYRAKDYFGDGSLYILDTPGHAVGHISALVRTTIDTFVFLGGDICHFGGTFRPSKYVPMPPSISSLEAWQEGTLQSPCPCSLFTACHPDPASARTSPYYKPCSRADSWYVDPEMARQSIQRLIELDASDNVLILIAHDPSLILDIPHFPNGYLNDWFKAGWKQNLRWKYLNELPIDGRPVRHLVSGTYRHGNMIKRLDGSIV